MVKPGYLLFLDKLLLIQNLRSLKNIKWVIASNQMLNWKDNILVRKTATSEPRSKIGEQAHWRFLRARSLTLLGGLVGKGGALVLAGRRVDGRSTAS